MRLGRLLLPLLLSATFACESNSPSAHHFSVAGQIVFGASLQSEHADLYAINPDGSGLRNLTKNPAYYDVPAPAPDGAAVAFTRTANPSDSGDIYVLDSTGVRRITFDQAYEGYPTWSPDGTRIAFVKNRDIYTIKPDGSDTTRLTLDGTDFKTTPAWSPDGQFIAYSRYADVSLQYELHRMTANGMNDTLLISLPDNDLSPAWSASGLSITFVHHEAEFGHLVRLDLTTGDTTTVTSGSVVDQSPAYSPIGDTLAFFRLDVGGPTPTQEVLLLPPGALAPLPVTAFGNTKYAYAVTWTGQP